MEWYFLGLIMLTILILVLSTGIPVAIGLLLINIIGAYLFYGHDLIHYIHLSIADSVTTFTYLPIVLFMLMGEVLFRIGEAERVFKAIGLLIGRLPGRFAVLTVIMGTIFAMLSGVAMANVALLGGTLLGEMKKRKYSATLSMGSVMASSGLAMIVPPSNLIVLYAIVAKLSVGKMLMAGFIPGLLMAFFYFSYIIIRATFFEKNELGNNSDDKTNNEMSIIAKILFSVNNLLPAFLIVGVVLGFIILGVATPAESAALGGFSAIVLGFLRKELNMKMLISIGYSALRISVMVLFILASSIMFSQLIARMGITGGIVSFVSGLQMPTMFIVAIMLLTVILLGCFLDQVSIMIITIPIFMPVIGVLGMEPIVFGIVMLIALEMALTTPPFGLVLYIMKGIEKESSILDLSKAAAPFLIGDALTAILVLAFPILVMYLPNMM